MSGCVRLNPDGDAVAVRCRGCEWVLAIGTFERYLSVWVGLCILLGVVLDEAVCTHRQPELL